MKHYNKQEQQQLDSLETGEWKSVQDLDKQKKQARKAAKKTLDKPAKNKQINVRVAEADLAGLKQRAKASGLPYQTLLNILIHQYVEGKIEVKV